MRVIYGTKVLTDEDLFENCSTSKSTKDFIKDNIEKVLWDLDVVCLHFIHRSTYQTQDFCFKFIPIDVIEKYIIYICSITSLEYAKKYVLNKESLKEIEDNIAFNRIVLDEKISKYTDGDKSIEKEKCAIIAMDKYDSVKEVKICIPEKIISHIESPMKYKCHKCGKVEYSDILPSHMFYEIKNDKIIYYCDKCKTEKAVYVGASFIAKK